MTSNCTPARRLAVVVLAMLRAYSFFPSAMAEEEYFDYEREHWAFVLPKAWPVPRFDTQEYQPWSQTPIDAFVLAKQLERGLRPSPEADRATLIRRLSFQLTGLPPTPDEVTAFVNDGAVNAYARLVDRLLVSPYYGEHWGQHWLDVVRYAETEEFEYDNPRLGAWRFRDYVIQSLNEDKPYDQFVREQLAGDELHPDDHVLLAAAGFIGWGLCDAMPGMRTLLLLTGRTVPGFPSMGSWSVFGLGSESDSLPAYVVMPDPDGALEAGQPMYTNGFLPAVYQPTMFRSGATPVRNLNLPADISLAERRKTVDLIRQLNEANLTAEDDELSARITAYELAFKMQTEAPQVFDLSDESQPTLDLYGIGKEPTDDYARRCLMARRLVEKGVRFSVVVSGGGPGNKQWDAHKDIEENHLRMAAQVDQPIAATDDIGLKAVESPYHFRDIHTTILHLLGLDQDQLTYPHLGRDERLTEIQGEVIQGIVG